MTPEISRAVAVVKAVLNLDDGPQLDALITAGNKAKTTKDLPRWAQATLTYAAAKGQQ